MNEGLKNKAMVLARAMALMKMEAVNVSSNDLAAGFDFLTSQLARPEGSGPLPLISANLVLAETRQRPFPPYLVINSGGIQIGIFGVTEKGSLSDPRLTVLDPTQTARSMIAALRDKCDLVIGLVAMDFTNATRLAGQVKGADILVVSDKRGATMSQPQVVKETLLAQAGMRGMFIGRMDLELDPEKKQGMSDEERAALDAELKSLREQRRSMAEQARTDPGARTELRKFRQKEREIMQKLKTQNFPFAYENLLVSIEKSMPEDPVVAEWVKEIEPKPQPRPQPTPQSQPEAPGALEKKEADELK